ncbi:ubiquitin carboxyl-terminal hydrolase 3-like [Hydractinia symbiolongicarpus]|uniref:ubiquitin carboxyl-terminal hydrolase 3-like n=1 Tax=Hydractinia symbiolongicarpus TaxID=13093 RepID=UPI00254D358F|nr:ubiquitin carboxyl-terminal hydrolase 3-like [Hydractinia symbiolongicarpus]
MECKHLDKAVDISPTFVRKLIEENRNLWTCAECRSNKSPWMCLKCGMVLCGRYVNGHCKAHGESNEFHFVCIDASLMVFCYQCDDFVINDTETGTVELIRTALQTEIPHQRKRRKRTEEQLLHPETPKKLLKSSSKENMYSNSPKKLKTVGIRNLGNTCFMNAILQSLSNLKHFSCYFKELPAIELNDEKGDNGKIKKYYTRSYQPDDLSLVEELRKILCALWQGATAAISPDALFSVVWKVVPRFRGYQQHDAHEFMHYLLDRVHTELLQTNIFSNGRDTIVSGIFGGQLQSEVTCLKCGTISKKKEPYWDLSLDIPCKSSKKSSGQKLEPKSKVCHLTDCLQRFIEVEELDESEWYTCEKCKKKQPSTKKFWLLQLPNVLCLHLKRFRYSPHGRTKVDTFVRFPITELNMNSYMLKQGQKQHRLSTKAHVYDLAAAVVHHGSGAGSGHYTTYARHEGAWYNFNDSTVSLTSEDSITHCKGYILFYTRQYPDVNIIERIKENVKRAK